MTEIATRADIERLEALFREFAADMKGATITPAPEWLTVKQMAEKRGIHPKTVRRKCAPGGEFESRGSGKTRMVRERGL